MWNDDTKNPLLWVRLPNPSAILPFSERRAWQALRFFAMGFAVAYALLFVGSVRLGQDVRLPRAKSDAAPYDPRTRGSVMIMAEDADGARTLCSGTLISDYHVVTAGHCFSDGPAVSLVTVSFGRSVDEPWETTMTAAARVHPAYDGAIDNTNDIAVLTLAERAPADWQRHEIGTAATSYPFLSIATGYGVGRLDGASETGGVYRDMILFSYRVPWDEHIRSASVSFPTPSFGDSGGGLFDEEGRLVGLLSSGQEPSLVAELYYVDLSSHLAWIRGVTGGRIAMTSH